MMRDRCRYCGSWCLVGNYTGECDPCSGKRWEQRERKREVEKLRKESMELKSEAVKTMTERGKQLTRLEKLGHLSSLFNQDTASIGVWSHDLRLLFETAEAANYCMETNFQCGTRRLKQLLERLNEKVEPNDWEGE